AALSLLGAQKASTSVAIAIPLMIFGLPLMDTGLAVFRRFVSRRPLFDADREHVHHMLLARGWSQGRVALVLYGVCAIFGLSARCARCSSAGSSCTPTSRSVGTAMKPARGRLPVMKCCSRCRGSKCATV